MWNISQVIFCLVGAGSDMMWRIKACWADAVGWYQYSNEGEGCKSMLEGNQDAAGLQLATCEVAWRHLVSNLATALVRGADVFRQVALGALIYAVESRQRSLRRLCVGTWCAALVRGPV